MSDPYRAQAVVAPDSSQLRIRDLRRRVIAGEATLGGWCAIPSPFAAEVLATLGFDWVAVDTQHGLIDYATMVGMLRALQAHCVPGLVRVSSNDAGLIGRALDAGATGIVVPMVNSPEDAERAVRACRYPPLGSRSWGPARPSLGRPDFTPSVANDEVLCVVMIETPEAVAQAREILSVPGVDAVYIGPWDLSLTVNGGAPDPGSSDRDVELIDAIRDAAEAAGVSPGIACGGIDHVRRWLPRGFRFVAINSDVGFLSQAASTTLAESRELCEGLS